MQNQLVDGIAAATSSHTPKEDYRCYHFRQSVTTLWNQQPATTNRRPANRKGFIGDRFMRAG